jgi:hypothetical protein
VSAKRSQLHAANLAHMPRYLFEQTLAVKSTLQVTRECGQRPAKTHAVVPPLAPPQYQLNFESSRGAYGLNASTEKLLRKLDKYQDGLGELRMAYQEKIAGLGRDNWRHRPAVKDMAGALWNKLTDDEDTGISVKVRDQFLSEVERAYNLGQRLTEIHPLKPAPDPAFPAAVDDDLIACLYKYLLSNTKELYHKHTLLEIQLDRVPHNTRGGLIWCFRNLAHETQYEYARDRMRDWQRLNANTQHAFQECLADAYIEGKRR